MADSHDKEIYKRPYNRPNERWVCGLAAEGRPCPHGPSKKGACHIGYECRPKQVADRWVCTRPDQYGGPCDSASLANPSFGPIVKDGEGQCCRKIHCTPKRSLRALRGRFSIVFCVILVGLILLALGGPWRNEFLSPGPLTINHQGASMASLEDVTHAGFDKAGDSESCHICHANFQGGLKGLVSSALQSEPSVSQSSQCLVCHTEDVGENALFTHALSGDDLAMRTAEAVQEPFDASKPISLLLASLSPGVQLNDSGQLACASCHREHNGTFFDLKRMDNQKCQTCHVKQFNSMADGHPEFSTNTSMAGYDYPYRRRTRLIYDHARHESLHFQVEENKALAPKDCTSCHEIEENAFTTRIKPFEQICASCHTANIVTSRDSYLPVFGYPSLESEPYEDLEADSERSIPRVAESPMSPIMMLLLESFNAEDPERAATFAEDFAKVVEYENDLSGIVYDEDSGTDIVGRLFDAMNAIQEASMDETSGGLRSVVAAQLERLKGAPVEAGNLDAMFGYPKPGSSVEKVIDDVGRKDIVEMSGWYVKESGYALDEGSWTTMLRGLEPYQALVDLSEDGGAGAYQDAIDFFSDFDAFHERFTDVVRVEGDDWVRAEDGGSLKSEDWEALVGASMVDGGAADTESEKESESTEKVSDTAAEGAEGAGDAAAVEPVEEGSELKEAGDAFVEWLNDKNTVKKWLESNIDLSGDSWTLRTPRSLYYRPIQHADPFTTAWLNYTASIYEKSPAAARLFDELSGRSTGSATGSCMKCHSIDGERNAAGELAIKVNWKSKQPSRDFTRFRHTPHLKLMNCTTCHRGDWLTDESALELAKAVSAEEETLETNVDSAATDSGEAAEPEASEDGKSAEAVVAVEATPAISYGESFQVRDNAREMSVDFANTHQSGEHVFASNFLPINKDMCAKCHVASKAGDNCLICHNYHIEPERRSFGIQSLTKLFEKEEAPAAAE